jgi:hypothetical protein
MRQDQGLSMECVYCTLVRPDIGGDCPECHGARVRFQPARMMDGPTSRDHVLSRFFHHGAVLPGSGGATERDRLLALLEEVVIYGFDPALALAEALHRVEEELE